MLYRLREVYCQSRHGARVFGAVGINGGRGGGQSHATKGTDVNYRYLLRDNLGINQM